MLVAFASLCALFACYWIGSHLYKKWTSPLRYLPGPKNPSWLFGNIKAIMDSEDSELHDKWFKAHGRVLKYSVLFGNDRLATLDGKALNHVLANSDVYQKPEVARFNLGRIVGQGVLVQEGDIHRQQRRAMNPAFGHAQIRELTEIFVDKSIDLRDVWMSECAKEQSRIDVLKWLSRATLDIIGQAGFNYKFEALNANEKQSELSVAFQTIFGSASRGNMLAFMQSQVPFLRNFNFLDPQRKETIAARKTMDRIGRELIDQSKAAAMGSGEKGENWRARDLLSLLVKANISKDVPEHQRMSDADVLAQVPTFITAGHETTSMATTWALFAMSKDKSIQAKLREALFSIDTENPTMDELNSITYLEHFVRETLRIHSPVAATIRVATEDDVIPLSAPFTNTRGEVQDNIKISKGDTIFIPITTLNRDEHYWGKDSLEFKPERWESLPEAVAEIPGVWGNMMTFLGGPHACIGYRFSLVEMKALLFVLVRSFEFDLAEPVGNIAKKSMVVTRPALRSDMKAGNQLPLWVKPYIRD